MKVAILCGGLGTRLTEETALKPKPMVEIGGQPILWHIMKIFSACGSSEFVLAPGNGARLGDLGGQFRSGIGFHVPAGRSLSTGLGHSVLC
jgi:NDP-sugar pyrophosphorylase family protein